MTEIDKKQYGLISYIPQQCEENIKTFKYIGTTLSLFYSTLWSPVCDFLIKNVVPRSIAPNLITLIGFIPLFLSHLLFRYYSPNLDAVLPPWVLITGGLSVAFYQLLDNLDGQQARATQNSTPLGMLFDHGLDTITSWLTGYLIMATLRIGNTELALFGLFYVPQFPFYFAMWTQYHAGAFKLGYINGIDEGLVIIELFIVSTAFTGQEHFIMKPIPGVDFRVSDLIVIINFFIIALQMFYFAMEAQNKRKEEFNQCLPSLWPVPVLALTLILIGQFSPSDVTANHLYLVYFGLSLAFSSIITDLQISFLSKKQFSTVNFPFIAPIIAILINYAAFWYNGKLLVEEQLLFSVIAVVELIQYSHMVYSVFMQISTILEIKIFKINKNIKIITS